MRNHIPVLFSLMIFVSCRTKTDQHENYPVEETANEMNPAWRAFGTEPFWNISINKDTILYTRLNEKIDSVYFTAHHFSDRDSILEFHFMSPGNKEAELVLRKGNTPCSDGMSDNKYAYSATFTYQKEILKGCAEKQ